MEVTQLIAIIALGLVLGSFTTALVYRVPRSIPWWAKNRSACPHCNATLKPLDLIPLVSWVLQKGKCRHCRVSIPIRYPIIELGVLLVTLATYAVFGFTAKTFFIIAALPFLIALLSIDLEYLILPDQLVLILGGLGVSRLAYMTFTTGSWRIALAGVIASLAYALFAWLLGWIMTHMLKRDALGFGDVKFFAVAGLWLGIGLLPWFLMLSGVFGIIFALLWRKFTKEQVFPFGPALIAALYGLLLFGGSLLA